MVKDRPTGLLTQTQREFLLGEKEYTGEYAKQQRYQRRKAIEKRVRNSILDFNILNTSNLPMDSIGESFVENHNNASEGDIENIHQNLHAIFSFIYKGVRETAPNSSENPIEMYEQFVADGIQLALNHEGVAVEGVSVSIDVEKGVSLEQLREKERLSLSEAKQLLRGGEITPEEFLQLGASLEDVDMDDNPRVVWFSDDSDSNDDDSGMVVLSSDDSAFYPSDEENDPTESEDE